MKPSKKARRLVVLEPYDTFGPWLNAASAARYLDFSDCRDPVNAFRKWARRVDPPLSVAHRGDRPLYFRADLDRAINAQFAKKKGQ